jgi:hypothetical protein
VSNKELQNNVSQISAPGTVAVDTTRSTAAVSKVALLRDVIWPGGRALLRALRWAGLGLIAGVLVGLTGVQESAFVTFLVEHEVLLLALVAALLVLAGSRHPIDRDTAMRVRRTHVELAESQTPVAWAYAAALGAAGFVSGAAWSQTMAIGFALSNGVTALAIVLSAMSIFYASAAIAAVVFPPRSAQEDTSRVLRRPPYRLPRG